MADDRIKILVTGRISTAAPVRLSNPSGTMDKGLIKPARVRLVGLLIAQVPLAKNATGVAGLLEDLRQNRGLERHAFAFEDGVRHAILHRVPTRHQRTARRRARGAHQEPREARAGVVQLVEVRRANPRMPMPADRPVALVVGNDENDVGRLGFGVGLKKATAENTEQYRQVSQRNVHDQLIKESAMAAKPLA